MAPHGDMGGMDMGSGTTDSGSGSSGSGSGTGHDMGMMAIFQNRLATSLYSESWTPSGAGAYAGTVIFLVALGIVFRALLALRARQEARWLDAELRRRYVVVSGKQPLGERVSRDSLAKQATLSANGVEEDVVVVGRRAGAGARPWRLSVDPVRALIDTVIAGVGYLLMLAVMTMNVGYFIAVLGGTFLGSLLVGRFNAASEH